MNHRIKEKENLKENFKMNTLSRGNFIFPNETKDFIINNFKIRSCNKYKEKSKDICECNRDKNTHSKISENKEEWSYINNTDSEQCYTFGLINFLGYEVRQQSHYSTFIRFDSVENRELTYKNLYDLLLNKEPWQLHKPKLIISINGGLQRMKFVSNQHKRILKQGIIKVIKQDQTWVFADGINIGIHKLVSEAICEFRLHEENMRDQVSLIGINTWGAIRDNDRLYTNDPKLLSNRLFKYENRTSSMKGKLTLDFLYDHFLFCDDGTASQLNKEMDFRLHFEIFIKNQVDGFLVQIIYGGDRTAIDKAYNALKNIVPLLVIKGTGGAADMISQVMELPTRKFSDHLSIIFEEFSDLFDKSKYEIAKYKAYLIDMYNNYKKIIVVYDIGDPSMKFDKKILHAMILGADKSLEKSLALCIRFNCPKFADKTVFQDPKYRKLDSEATENMFMTTLKDDKPEFTELFILNNFDVKGFISENGLKELYDITFDKEKCPCAEMLSDVIQKMNFSKDNDFYKIGFIIQKLSGNILANLYHNCCKESKCVENYDKILFSQEEDDDEYEENDKVTKWSVQDLFLWALLSGRIELSRIFWKMGVDHIASALMASTILKEMAYLCLVRGENSLNKKLINASSDYENLAVSVTTEAFSKSKSKTYSILIRELKIWDGLTCIQIAVNGELKEFLNHNACKTYTTKIWMGDLSPYLSNWKIILNIPFSLFLMHLMIIPTFPRKKSSKTEKDKFYDQSIYGLSKDEIDISSPETSGTTFSHAMNIFYNSTVVKFYIYLVSYIIFLLVFCYFNLVELQPVKDIRSVKDMAAEIYLYIYVLTFSIEEIRQIFEQNLKTILSKLQEYFSGDWNKFDVFIILLFLVSTIIRFSIDKDNFILCRCFFASNLSLFFLRFMQFYFINKSIGPKVIMIRQMLKDIVFFLSIFVIFVLAYGTLLQSLKFPNSNLTFSLIKDVIYFPYFQSYGELMLDSFDASAPCEGSICIVRTVTIVICFAIFLLLTNILLVNLLIAMFGYTFNIIQEESEKLWSFNRIQLVMEFYDKNLLPPPFNIFYLIYRGFLVLFTKFCSKPKIVKVNNLISKKLEDVEDFKMTGFEQFCMEASMMEIDTEVTPVTDKNANKMTTNTELYDNVNVPTDQSPPTSPMDSFASFQTLITKRLENIERKLDMQLEKINLKSQSSSETTTTN